jgi:hypothetical protein
MGKSKSTEVQIIGVLREHEAGAKTAQLCLKRGASAAPQSRDSYNNHIGEQAFLEHRSIIASVAWHSPHKLSDAQWGGQSSMEIDALISLAKILDFVSAFNVSRISRNTCDCSINSFAVFRNGSS